MLLAAKVARTYKATADLLVVRESTAETGAPEPDLRAILTSPEVLGRVIDRFNVDTTPAKLATKIEIRLPTNSSPELTYEDRDAPRAAIIANGIADESASYFKELATRGYGDILQALNEQVKESLLEIAAADRSIQRAQAADTPEKSAEAPRDAIAQVGELLNHRFQSSASLAVDQSTASELNHELATIQPIVRGEILRDDLVDRRLRAGLKKDVVNLRSTRASLGSGSPEAGHLARLVARERKRLSSYEDFAVRNGAGLSPLYAQTIFDAKRVAALESADRERLRLTNSQLVAKQRYGQKFTGDGAALATLKARRDGAFRRYLALNERLSRAEADAAAGGSLGKLVIVSRAIPQSAEPPLPLLGGIFGLMIALAICVAFACDAADRRLWSVRDIEDVYGHPIFMEIDGRS